MISNIAKRYARAFFELAEEENKLEQYYNELNLFSSIMKQNKDLNGFLVNPIFEQEDKKRVLEQVISKLSLSPMTINFLKLLIDKKRIDALADIESCYRQQMDEVLKKLRATVKTAFPLSEEMLAYVTSGLENDDLPGKGALNAVCRCGNPWQRKTAQKRPCALGGQSRRDSGSGHAGCLYSGKR